jgi:hypothetical protein
VHSSCNFGMLLFLVVHINRTPFTTKEIDYMEQTVVCTPGSRIPNVICIKTLSTLMPQQPMFYMFNNPSLVYRLNESEMNTILNYRYFVRWNGVI